jgi:hypothetical protein
MIPFCISLAHRLWLHFWKPNGELNLITAYKLQQELRRPLNFCDCCWNGTYRGLPGVLVPDLEARAGARWPWLSAMLLQLHGRVVVGPPGQLDA